MNPKAFESLIDQETQRFQAQNVKKPLWKVLFSKEFLPSFIKIILLRVFTVWLGFLPQRLMDTYLRNLTQLTSEPIEVWVFGSGLAFIIVLYAQGNKGIITHLKIFLLVYIGNWVEKQKHSFFIRLKLWLHMLLIQQNLLIKTLTSDKERPNFLNLITQDINRIESGLNSIIDTFGILLELSLALYYLKEQLGEFQLGLPLLVLSLIIGNILLVGLSQLSALKGQKARDQRISLLQELLQGMRAVKLLGAEGVFKRKVFGAREREFGAIRTVRLLDAVFNSFIRSVGLGIMGVLALWNEGLGGKSDLFSGLVLVNQLVYPITAFPWSVGSAFGVVFPYGRISGFLSEKQAKGEKEGDFEEGVVVHVKEMSYRIKEEVPLKAMEISDFVIKKGDFVIIYGENGTGKTTFLRLLLKELLPSSGQLCLDSSEIAYVSQDTWLLQGTFEDNILFGMPFEKEKYDACIEACCLKEEILLKEKDFSIGVNGIRLSGGQRQRVALCRALYQDKGVYFLDDIMSSLDKKVANEIFDQFVMKNLVNKGKTVLFITSQSEFLPFAHKAYELKNGVLSSIKKTQIETPFENSMKETVPAKGDPIKEILQTKGKPVNELTQTKEIALSYLQPFDSKGFHRYLKAIGLKTLLMIITISLSQQAMRHYAELLLNNTLSSKTPLEQSFLAYLAVFYLSLTLARGLIYCYGVLKAAKAFFKELLQGLLEANMEFFEKYPPGELMGFLMRDLDSMDCNLPEDINGWASTMINIIGIFGVVIYEFPVLMVVCWVVGNRAFRLYWQYSKRNKELKQEIKGKEAGLLNDLMEFSQ